VDVVAVVMLLPVVVRHGADARTGRGLCGPPCQTGNPSPGSHVYSGTVDLATFGLSASGEFEIPRFKGCGLLTPILSALVSGPGNTFSTGPSA
jgi:hypothetical protein